jgi:hypothetical protein
MRITTGQIHTDERTRMDRSDNRRAKGGKQTGGRMDINIQVNRLMAAVR